ncbi:MAG: prolipoprotein diacylglyceryl transferase [bacterium]|nr:prolipoprotein diacylglyceryl transferase [bacterium]
MADSVVYNVVIFGLNLKIKRVAFTLPIMGGWHVYWYGIIIAVGFLGAIVYFWRNAKRFGLQIDAMTDVILVTTPLAILCARAYYLLFNYGNLSGFFRFHDGGLAIYGGVIGAAVFGVLMCKIRKVNLGSALDVAAIGFLIGQGIGRWGNFFNQEAFGTPTNSSFFGMASENTAAQFGEGVLVHPCFLYESVLCLLGAWVLHLLSKKRKFNGQIALAYGIWYGFVRMFIEGLRTDSLMLGLLRVSQVLSLVLFVVCSIVMVIILRRIKSQKNDNGEYSPLFSMSDSQSFQDRQQEAIIEDSGEK